jgi:hypothetical protein
MTTVERLRAARELLSDPARWCRSGGYARNAFGSECSAEDPNATSWCALGALRKFDGDPFFLARALGVWGTGLVIWNDCQATHTDLLAAFDRAIELAGTA